ncbi:Gfo/Idh/MocA family oxidoreductase [Amylibacter sp.]|nr:Gfo/Idh/MocA family oxidoreductase [Amylibacter sp.]
MKTLKIGIIGFSDGNGHPYSWASIFNGYNPSIMEDCGFPLIPRYLEQQKFPDDTIKEASVTHVWTQDFTLSKHISKAANIPNVVRNFSEMINHVDAILLARDDAETHYELAAPFLNAGLPIYIDKPFTLSVEECNQLYDLEQFPGQIFTCSALKYAQEFQMNDDIRSKIGKLRHICASTPKSWDKYGLHVIEPLLKISGDQGRLMKCQVWNNENRVINNYLWESGFQATISALGNISCPLGLRLIGENGWHDMIFKDSFFAFRAALNDFIQGIINKDVRSDPRFVRKTVEIIQLGRSK